MLDSPLKMHYDNLDPTAQYKMRIVYGGDGPRKKIRCMANDTIEVHPLIAKKVPYGPVEFDIPAEATAGGPIELELVPRAQPGRQRPRLPGIGNLVDQEIASLATDPQENG